MRQITVVAEPFMVHTAETVDSPQLQSVLVVDISFVAQRQFPMVLTFQLIIEIPLRTYLVVDVPVMRAVQSLRCRRGEDIRAPTVAAR